MKKALLVYGSTWGNTAKVVRRVPEWLSFPIDVVDVKTLNSDSVFAEYDLFLFFAPTAGDQELQEDMEQFFIEQKPYLHGKPYAVCELGNYFGYDDFDLGAEKVLSYLLLRAGGWEFIEPVCMDTFPYKDWDTLKRWCDALNQAAKNL